MKGRKKLTNTEKSTGQNSVNKAKNIHIKETKKITEIDKIKCTKEFLKLKEIYTKLKSNYSLSFTEIAQLLEEKELLFPITIFNKRLSGLEVVSKYLVEEEQIRIQEIAKLMNRSEKTIWQALNSASKKHTKPLKYSKTKFLIPLKIFADRNLSILEHIVSYLKETFRLKFTQIAVLLKRNPRTIWTVYNRAKNKLISEKNRRNG